MSEAVFAREPLVSMLEAGLEDLLRAHWKEVALDQDVIAYNPDWTAYLETEARGQFFAWSLRMDGVLVGYNAFSIIRSAHYRDHYFAMNDVIYLKPDMRGIEGIAMILQAEKELKDMGVTKVFYHVKTDFVLGDLTTGDSLEAIEALQGIEERFDVKVPDGAYVTDGTLGDVLAALGYGHVENHFAKLLRGAT